MGAMCFVRLSGRGGNGLVAELPMILAEGSGSAPANFRFDNETIANNRAFRDRLNDGSLACLCNVIEGAVAGRNSWEGSIFLGHGVAAAYSIEPMAVKTEDGYLFRRQEDGSYSDGDLSWGSWQEFRERCEVEWSVVE